jgi:phosphatidylinositol alpha-mannosyltransferase
MRIALVSPYDWSVPGGVNAHVTHLARCFGVEGHEATIFAPASDPASAARECVPIGRTVSVRASGSVQRITPAWHGRRVSAALAEGRFDIVHLHEPLMPALPYAFLRHSRAVNVGTFHAAKEGGNRLYALGRPLLRRQAARLAARIAVSPAAERLAVRYFPGEYTTIPNGIEFGHFAGPHEPLPEFEDGRCNLLFVGRPEKRKGLQFLLRAYTEIREQRPGATRLIVVGAGDFARFERAMQGMDDVVFRAGVSYAELPRYHASAHVFCSPATGNESQGIALLEGMAAGLPVVASDIEGFATMVTHGKEGVLVAPRDSDALRDAILGVLSDAAGRERYGAEARRTAERYRWERVAGEVLALYESLLAGRTALTPGPSPTVAGEGRT